jgi:hypothetical protein
MVSADNIAFNKATLDDEQMYVTYIVFYPPALLGGMIKSYITL